MTWREVCARLDDFAAVAESRAKKAQSQRDYKLEAQFAGQAQGYRRSIAVVQQHLQETGGDASEPMFQASG